MAGKPRREPRAVASTVAAPVTTETADAFSLMDRLDDDAIVRELEGQIVEHLVYHFRDERTGTEVWGLSKPGVDEACRELARRGEVIREEKLEWEIHDGFALFRVLAARYAVNRDGTEARLDSAWGVKRQSIAQWSAAHRTRAENPHWFEQGAMKAARNARSRLVPAELRAAIIARAKEAGRVRTIAPPAPTAVPDAASKLAAEYGIDRSWLARWAVLDSRLPADPGRWNLAHASYVADQVRRHGWETIRMRIEDAEARAQSAEPTAAQGD